MSEEVTPLEFLEAVYLNEKLPLTVRMRAAIEAAPYKHHKLSAAQVMHYDGKDFASRLERAIERSSQVYLPAPPTVIDATPEIDATVMKRPFASYRRF
jgi:hypothetical protein